MKNKKILLISLICWIIVFLIILSLALLFVFPRTKVNFLKVNFFDRHNTLSKNISTQYVIEKSETFSGINKIILNIEFYDIQIKSSKDIAKDNVLVEIERDMNKNNKYYNVAFSKDNNVLTLEQKAEKQRINIFNLKNITTRKERGRIIITVQDDTLSELDCSALGDIDIDTKVKKIIVNTVSGDVNIKQAGQYVSIAAVSADAKIFQAFEKITIETVSGDIKVVASNITKDISVDSISGDTTIKLDGINDYNLSLDSVSGDVINTYKNNTEASKSNLTIKATTVSGDIKFSDWR